MQPSHAHLETAIPALAQDKQWQKIHQILETIEPNIKNLSDWRIILNSLQVIPEDILFHNESIAPWFASALIGTRTAFAVLTTTQATHHPTILVARAWVLLGQDEFKESHDLLHQAIPYLTSRIRNFAHLYLARSCFALGLLWQEQFQVLRLRVSGRTRGLFILEEAVCYARTGDSVTARDLWLEALPLFKSDLYHQAWLRYNLGISCAKDLIPDADRHFYELQRLAKKPALTAWQSRAWSGVGVTHRVRGEWDRAIFAYRRAEQTALEPDDHIEATSSLALTLRLAGRIPEALEVLVLSDYQNPALEMQKIACYLAINNLKRAKTILETVQTQVSADLIRLAFFRAEIARLELNPNAALACLESVPHNHLVTREEAMYWQLLRGLCQAMNLQIPLPLEYNQQTIVSVYALGGLRVLVNARLVSLEPRCAELLVLLLEHGNVISLVAVGLLLFPDSPSKTAQSNVRRLLVALRDALSWSDAVVLDNKTIFLNTNAQWFYDVTEARAIQYAHAEFIPGADKPWMLEVAAQLRLLGHKLN